MKKLFYYLIPAIMIFAIQSCSEDPTDDIEPTLVFVTGANYITADATITTGSIITTKVKALKGSNNLTEFKSVQRRAGETTDTKVDISNYKINGTIDQNPKLILASNELSGFEYEISFPASTIDEEITYTFILTDDKNQTASVSVKITTQAIKTINAAKLFNKQGPVGKGGIDLHTGTSTGSMDASAELVDLGNNNDAKITYKNQFQARTNETIVKATSETWESLNSDANIQAAFNSGNNIGTVITAVKGNIYVIQSGIFYFAIKITDIVDDPSTVTFANDYIQMDIKQKY